MVLLLCCLVGVELLQLCDVIHPVVIRLAALDDFLRHVVFEDELQKLGERFPIFD